MPYLAAPFLSGGALVLWWRRTTGPCDSPAAANPLQVGPALQMAAMFQVVLFIVGGVGRAFGDAGLHVAGALLGLTDVDALTISMTTSAAFANGPAVAAEAIAIGILANCLMKLVLAVALGAPRFARTTASRRLPGHGRGDRPLNRLPRRTRCGSQTSASSTTTNRR